ncbi:ADP ribosylase [Citrobacter phage CkP1]|nr:ADP ribosylase [Citrobacter phage CkP1]
MLYQKEHLEEIRYQAELNPSYYEQKISQFSDYEQSTLWRCFNDKADAKLHLDLDPIVRRNITQDVPVELYRGVSKKTASWLQGMEVGRIIADNRVTSFSTDFSVARQFAGAYCYGTHIILSLRNCPFAFNFQEHAMNLVLAAPDSEFKKDWVSNEEDERMEKLEMINAEDEWMFPIGTQFEIVSIEDYQVDPRARVYTIYHLNFYSF